MKQVNLEKFKKKGFLSEHATRKILWIFASACFFENWFPFPNRFKRALLIAFGARAGKNTVIKPRVKIKFPWLLELGKSVWIGEQVWIENPGIVKIGNNVCISQGAMILTGNHNYSNESFDFVPEQSEIEDGAWIGAKAIVCPGVIIASHSVLLAGAVATEDTQQFTIYQGNPAVAKRKREIK
jgi:putative colanic acid biosynthesis acetyltransferase WcaF